MPRVKAVSTCEHCGGEYHRWSGNTDQKYCSEKCNAAVNNTSEKGKRAVELGREAIRASRLAVGDTSGYYRKDPSGKHEHRVVMERILGRPLSSDEIVHHKDGNKRNNEPENLEVTTRAAHFNHHLGREVMPDAESY